jgi:uncharacterized protein (DUF924 family)
MPVKLLSESMDATITDEDQIGIDAVLSFWFMEQELSAPQIDHRMDIWFGEDEVFDLECKKEFAGDVDKASQGKLDHWAHKARGRLALILLLDQQIYNRLVEAVSPTYRETFETIAQFAELHHDIVQQFGRFPHRNKLLNRDNTPEEDQYLAGDSPDFGQGS